MKYWKVKPEFDQCRRSDGSIYIASELYTPKQVLKFKLRLARLEPVEVSQRKTYFSFGARFEMKDNA